MSFASDYAAQGDMSKSQKILRIIAGPNGAGKSTMAALLFGKLEAIRFINADVIAKGLDLHSNTGADLTAGRVMLKSIHEAIEEGVSFSFESTMSGKIWIQIIKQAINKGFRVELLLVYLESPEMCLARVAQRVRSGGHNIPEKTLRRRYQRTLTMFSSIYSKLIDNWYIFDNSNGVANFIARKEAGTLTIEDKPRYATIMKYAD
jgi:predicted ABC-type ATPase